MPPQDPQQSQQGDDSNGTSPPDDQSQQDDQNGSNGTSQPGDGTDDPATPTPEAQVCAKDSNDSDTNTADNQPEPAAMTTDTNRMTFSVPNDDETILNLGTHGGPPEADFIQDTGITGRTKTHIHFHTTEEPQTMLLLGNKTLEGFAGYKGNNLAAATGYMLVTQGAAWHESAEQMYMVSAGEDVILRAGLPTAPAPGGAGGKQRVLLQADTGSVWVGAGGKGVLVGSKGEVKITASPTLEMSDADYKGEISEKLEAGTLTFRGQTLMKWIGRVSLAQAAYKGLKAIVQKTHAKKGDPTKKGPIRDENYSIAEHLAEGAAFLAKQFTDAHKTNSVEIMAADNVAAMAGGALELFGQLGAGLASSAATDMSGLTVAAKGVLFAELAGGFGASVKGKEVTLESGKATKVKSEGDVILFADKNVTALAESGALVLQAAEENAVLFGESYVYVASAGYGVKANKSQLEIGKMSSPTDFGSAKGDASSLITFNSDGIVVANKNGTMLINSDGDIGLENAKSANVELKGSNVTISGKKILVG